MSYISLPRFRACGLSITALLCCLAGQAHGAFDLTINLSGFTAEQEAMFAQAETMWEDVITGYQLGISRTGITINAQTADLGGAGGTLAQAGPTGSTNQGGFRLTTSGTMTFDIADLPNLTNNGRLVFTAAHEIGHILGIGTQWNRNNVYVDGTGQYTGAFGVAAYQQEFDPDATFVPVELNGGGGTVDSHWDETSSVQDPFGRDLDEELMTGFLSGSNFLSTTTVQSLRDIGFEVVGGANDLITIDTGLARNDKATGVIGQLFTTQATGLIGAVTRIEVQRASNGSAGNTPLFMHVYSDTDTTDGIDTASFLGTSLNAQSLNPTDSGISLWDFDGTTTALDPDTQYLFAFANSTTPGDTTTTRTALHDGLGLTSDFNTIFRITLDTDFSTGVLGDVNQDGVLDALDVDAFVLGWRSDTTGLPTERDQIMLGDLNLDGMTNLTDAFELRNAFAAAGLNVSLASLAVPEPASGLMLAGLLLTALRRRRHAGLDLEK